MKLYMNILDLESVRDPQFPSITFLEGLEITSVGAYHESRDGFWELALSV